MNSNLPKDIEQFLKTLEELTWARILSYGNGPDTDALVHLSR
jgi:adenylosuccinate synthase